MSSGYVVAVASLALCMTAVSRDRRRLGAGRTGALLTALPLLFLVGLARFGITDDLDDPLVPWGTAAVYLTFLAVSAGHPALLTLDLGDAADRALVTRAEARRLPWQRRGFLALVVVGALSVFAR